MARNRIAASLLSGCALVLLLTNPGMAGDSVLQPQHFSFAGDGSALPPQRLSVAGDVGSVAEPAYRLAQAPSGAQARPAATPDPDQWRSDEWRFSVTPLAIWAFGVDGDITVRGFKRDIDVSFSDLVDKADGSIGFHGEVGRGGAAENR